MLFKTILTVAACCCLLFSSAQKDEAAMEIGAAKMNLHVMPQPKSAMNMYSFLFVPDLMYEAKLPRGMWKIDTSIQIEPVSQQEETVYIVDSTMEVHTSLGQATKQEINEAIASGFNLTKHCLCTISSADLLLITSISVPVHIDYSQPEQIQAALKMVEGLPKNSMIIISGVKLKCPDNQGSTEEESFSNLAVVKVGE